MLCFFHPSSFHSVVGSRWLFPKETGFRSGLSSDYIYHTLLFQYLEPPLVYAPVWFHVLDCNITDTFCHSMEVLGGNEASSRCW